MSDGKASPKRPAVLLVTFSADYPAPARMPRELHRAGLEVVMLAPRGALCTKTRFVDKLNYMPEEHSVREWIEALADLARATGARLLLPGDDVAVQALMQIAFESLPLLRPGVQAELTALIRRSLGDPTGYFDSINKGRLAQRARALGLPVPPGESVVDVDAALRVAAAIGYPVIVRPTFGWGSRGVRVCTSAADVRAAMAALPQLATWVPPSPERALVQRVTQGRQVNRAALAWEGREVAGFCRVRLRPPPEVPGAASVSRYVALPEVASLNQRLLAGLGASGLVATEYRLDADKGTPYLIEINRRMVPATHTGALIGVDLAAALAATLRGVPWTGPADMSPEKEHTRALFPQEWLRDRASPDLVALPTDAPWDDPGLFQAMLGLGAGPH